MLGSIRALPSPEENLCGNVPSWRLIAGVQKGQKPAQEPTFTILSQPLSWPFEVHLVEASDVSPNKSRL
jgi:hypothetical protein